VRVEEGGLSFCVAAETVSWGCLVLKKAVYSSVNWWEEMVMWKKELRACAGAVAGEAPPQRGAVRWISQPPGAGAGGGTLLAKKSLLKSWRAAWDRMRREVGGNLGGH
jgi:hypothetical protein